MLRGEAKPWVNRNYEILELGAANYYLRLDAYAAYLQKINDYFYRQLP